MMTMVDGASCMGHGRCYLMATDLLTYDDEGYVTIRDQPIEVLGDGEGPVTGLRVARNRLERDPRSGVRAVATGAHEEIPCGLVIRSVGHRGRALPGVPFDARRGLSPTTAAGCATRMGRHGAASTAPVGRPRVKLARIPEMLAVAGQKTGVSV